MVVGDKLTCLRVVACGSAIQVETIPDSLIGVAAAPLRQLKLTDYGLQVTYIVHPIVKWKPT